MGLSANTGNSPEPIPTSKVQNAIDRADNEAEQY